MNKIYRIFGLGMMLLAAITVWAVPARRGWVEKQMEDGRTVRVQQVGDEFYHYWVNEQGERLELKGERFVATGEVPTQEQVAARRAASPLMNSGRKVGKVNLAPRGLVILAAYKDVAYQAENTQAAMSDMMNKEGYDYNGATGSAADYFKAQSNGKYCPVFDVVGPVTLPQNRAYYGENKGNKDGADKDAVQMIIDACQAVDDQVDFTLYDNDKNGIIDFVYVIYAGIGENDRNSDPEAVWAHNWYVYSSAGKTCYLDGKLLDSYACSGEIDGITSGRNGIGVICHEFGHVIGLPDYYDTKYQTNFEEGLTPNNWSIMDQGCYNNNSMTPPNYSIFDKYFMGWATPKFLSKDEKTSIRMGTGFDDAYQITGGSELVPYSNTNTIYYIENRQKQGWDAHIPGSGMVVWKVRYSQTAWNNNVPNNTAHDPRLTIVAADGSSMIGDIYENGQVLHRGYTDPFPGKANVHSFTPFTGCELTDIQETNGKILFKFNGGKTECEFLVMTENCTVSEELGELTVGDPLELTITPESGYVLNDPDCWAVEMGSLNPLLEYGVDFTYDSETGAFRIEEVTDDVVIIVEAKVDSATSVEAVNGERLAVSGRKVFRNGQLYIIKGEKMYSVLGIRLK